MSASARAGTAGPFTVEARDGATLHGLVTGQGPTLLLVTGLSGTAAFWSSTAAALARSFRVISFDQRGIGASSRGSAPCTIDQLAEDCFSVLDATGTDRAVVLGHSTGGCIGQAMARLAPGRLDGLILSATWLRPSRYMTSLFGTRRAILAANPHAYAATSALMSYPPNWIEANWAAYEAALAAAPVSAQAQQIVRERIDALMSFDGSDAVASLAMPIKIMGARDDIVVPAFLQEELAAALPGSRKTILETGGHLFPVSRPDAFTASVAEWIGELQ